MTSLATISNTTAGCSDWSLVDPDFRPLVIYHADDGKCYNIDQNGDVVYYWNYGYNPGFATGIVFCVLFGGLSLLHLVLALSSRPRWLVVIAIGGMGELIGWIGRAASGKNNGYSVVAGNYFLVQIVCLTISPTFFSGAAYGLYVMLVNLIDVGASRFAPKRMAWTFVACDVISLVIQAAGGGIASSASTQSEQDNGTHIMVAGIAFQLLVMVIFSFVALDYFCRLPKGLCGALPRGTKLLILTTVIGSDLIILRGVYRTVELSQGWSGYLITHEGYFLGLDAVPMLLTMTVFAIGHPRFTVRSQLEVKHADAQFENAQREPKPEGGF